MSRPASSLRSTKRLKKFRAQAPVVCKFFCWSKLSEQSPRFLDCNHPHYVKCVLKEHSLLFTCLLKISIINSLMKGLDTVKSISPEQLCNCWSQRLGMNYYVQKVGGIGLNVNTGNKVKWIIGTRCNWKKKSKSSGSFWSYQQNNTANSAHLAHFGSKLAWLAVLSSR